ncbi:unnamed protein product [Rhizoctonia solani]|uniref:Uncharacterized protein n=1 Tax=Rhizoctonia solani TaxID=456999 RepID=A0A8H3DZ07_9AGAM|nr:unnamed protein product [Rhizoctonia solani]
MAATPHTPFPFNVTAISPLFQLSPVTSNNTNLGWVPSCATPECLPTASWSTSAINSTLSFRYWGWDVAFDGIVKGNLSIQIFVDGTQEIWSPAGNTLFSHWSTSNEGAYEHNITLKVLDASSDAQLTINQARVNGSAYADYYGSTEKWTIPSNDDRLVYEGFVPQTSVTHSRSSTTYTSSRIGDSLSLQSNASAFVVYGPCGPTSGLLKVTVENLQRIQQQIVNTSKPFASEDCLLFQTWGLAGPTSLKKILIENVDGGMIGINRFEAFKVKLYSSGGPSLTRTGIISGAVVGAIAVSVIVIVVYVKRKAKRRAKRHWEKGSRLKWLC